VIEINQTQLRSLETGANIEVTLPSGLETVLEAEALLWEDLDSLYDGVSEILIHNPETNNCEFYSVKLVVSDPVTNADVNRALARASARIGRMPNVPSTS
jgi:hypothetical protein